MFREIVLPLVINVLQSVVLIRREDMGDQFKEGK